MKNVWETCEFSDEIVKGDLKLHKFAVELHDFLDGKADPVYQDPKTCMDNTFLTEKMEYIVKDAILRVTKSEGTPVTAINTGFGGGKTHTIILLHHIFNNKDLGARYLSQHKFDKKYGVSEIPDARMVAIDCRHVTKNTLWGEIADKVGKYDLVKSNDKDKQPVQNIDVIKSFFDRPTVLLLDELPHYMLSSDSIQVGNVTLAELTANFIEKLVSVVASSKNSCLILTLTDTQSLYEKYAKSIAGKMKNVRAETIDDILKQALSRQVSITTPVSKKQIYDVIRTRLIKQINDNEKEETLREYSKYLDNKDLLPDVEYKDKMRSAYPFHPFLIDTLYERVSTIEKFNKTRAMLLLLGLILHDILTNKSDCTLIGTPDVNLSHDRINDALTSQIDKDLKQVIDSDCIRHAEELDSGKSTKIHMPIARTIYIHSLHGFAKKSGIRLGILKLAVCRPHMDPSLVENALEEIDKNFWYIKSEGGEYYFDEVPNINRIILDHRQDVTDKEVRDTIQRALNRMLPVSNGIYPIIWDRSELDDSDKLRLFVVDYEKSIDSEESAKTFISNVLENMPNGAIRSKQNTIAFLYADRHGVDSLKEKARLLCSIKKAENDERIKLDQNYLDQMKSRLERQNLDLKTECSNVYSKIGYPAGPVPRLDDISMLDSKSGTVTDAVFDLLKNKGKLIPELSPDGLPEIKEKIQVKMMHDLFKTDKGKKFVQSSAVMNAVQSGIEEGKFGYSKELVKKNGKYIADIGKHIDVEWSGWIINKDLVAVVNPPPPPPPPGTLKFEYEITLENFNAITKILSKIPILDLDEKFEKSISAEIKIKPDTTISLTSGLDEHQWLKSVLESIQSKSSGEGKLTIKSNNDLQKEFEKYDIEAKQV